MVASFGEALQGRADLKATTKSVKGQDLALLSSTTAAERLRSEEIDDPKLAKSDPSEEVDDPRLAESDPSETLY